MSDGERTESGSMGGGPRVRVEDCPSSGPLMDSKKGMDQTVEPRTKGTIGGGQTSNGSKPK